MTEETYQPKFFAENTADDYATVLMSPHRNAPPRVRPPSVVANICYWNAFELSRYAAENALTEHGKNRSPEKILNKLRKNRKSKVDDYICSIWRRLKESKINDIQGPSVIGDHILLFNSYRDVKGNAVCYFKEDGAINEKSVHDAPGSIINFSFPWRETLATIRVEQRTEYASFTFIIDLSAGPDSEKRKSLDGPPESPVKQLADALDRLNERIAAGEHTQSATEKDAYENAYQQVWEVFYEELLKPSEIQEKALGEIFVDIRGLVLASPLADKSGGTESYFQKPFWRTNRGDVIDNDKFFGTVKDIKWPAFRSGLEVVMSFWPFITMKFDGISLLDHEIIACGLLGGRAVYVSGLGPQPTDTRATKSRRPILYFLYCNMLDGWQIGRLITQLHQLGVERLAAMKYFEKLRTAGYDIRELSREIEQTRKRHEKRQESADHKKRERHRLESADKDKCPERTLVEEIRDIDEKIAEMQKDFDDNLSYRMHRSSYYIQQFRSGISALRVRRIEGFQPYDRFVERRLGPAFELIELLTAEFENLKHSRANLFQYYTTRKTEEMQKNTASANEEISHIQVIADIALWWALIPYYVGTQLFEHILDYGNGSTKMFASWLVLWASCIAIWRILTFSRHYDWPVWARRAALFACAIFLVAMTQTIYSHRPPYCQPSAGWEFYHGLSAYDCSAKYTQTQGPAPGLQKKKK